MKLSVGNFLGGGKVASEGGGGGPPPFEFPTTDLLGAWSPVRVMKAGYLGPLCRVRWAGHEDIEQDLYPDASLFLTQDVIDSSGYSGDAYLVGIYDQAGGPYGTATCADAAQQGLLVSGSVLNTFGPNARPCVTSDGSVGPYLTGTTTDYTQTVLSALAAGQIDNASFAYSRFISVVDGATVDYGTVNAAALILKFSTNAQLETFRSPYGDIAKAAITFGEPFAAVVRYDGTNANMLTSDGSGSNAASAAFAFDRVVLMGASTAVTQEFHSNCYFAEAALWGADLGATLAASLQSEIATIYG